MPSRFPDAVRIKTPTLSFNRLFYFALDDKGRIWFKSIRGGSKQTETIAVDWRLYLDTGLPHDPHRKHFVRPPRIVSINADLDELMAVADDHRHYSVRWLENPVFKEHTPVGIWADRHGWPVDGALMWDSHVADNRGWAIGRRTRNFVHFEDVTGRTFDGGGGLSTYYVLTADGTSIAFTDSGLPPDFSHTIGGPDRSTFVAEAMEVSADTLFLINAYGELRTRMVDFDTDGSDTMFFVYTYDRTDTRAHAIAIPAEDWLAHAPIPLEGQAQIGARLAIVLTGQHNRDRQLRVAGYDSERHLGYYFKPIFDQEDGSATRTERDDWGFAIDDTVSLDDDRLLDPADTDPSPDRARRRTAVPLPRWQASPKPPRRVALRNLAFEGEIRVDGVRVDVEVHVPDFHFDWSPATLRLSHGADAIDLTLHMVERWYHLRRFDPGHDGTPQAFQATLQIPPSTFATTHPFLRRVVDALDPYDLVAFAFSVQATHDYLEITSNAPGEPAPHVAIDLVREGRGYPSLASAKRESLRREDCSAAARTSQLLLDGPLTALTAADIPLLRSKIRDNRRATKTLTRAVKAPEREDRATPSWLNPTLLAMLGRAARPWLIKLLMPALPFRNLQIDEATFYAKNLGMNVPALLSKSRAIKDALLGYAYQDLDDALAIIATRIAAYSLRLEQLASRTADKRFDYFEDLASYWAPLRFGQRDAVVPGMPSSYAVRISDEALFAPIEPVSTQRRRGPPGLLIEMDGTADTQIVLRAIPVRLGQDVFRASLHHPATVGSADNPLRTTVRVQLDHLDRTPTTQSVLAEVFRTLAIADHQEVVAELTVHGDLFRISATDFAVEWQATRATSTRAAVDRR